MDEHVRPFLDQIRQYEPDLPLEQVELNQEGMVNTVVVVNGRRVFRFPRFDWAVEHLRHEACCLELARAHIAMPVPRWTLYDGRIAAYDWLPGVALQRFHILRADEQTQDALAAQLGVFLRQLHAIPPDSVQAAGIGPSVTVRSRERWLQLYEDVRRELFPLLMRFSRDWVEQHFAPLLADPAFSDYQPTFVNGDLGVYHLLYDEENGRLNGVIDFGTAGLGDPAVDFACLLDQYGETFVRRVARHYPALDVALIERARFWAGTLELQWLLGGLRHPEDPSWFAVHIGRARDVRPIGSGWQL